VKFPLRRAAAALLLLPCNGSTLAAKPVVKPNAATLSFNVTARIAVKDGPSSSPEQTVNAKVYASGNRVRLESKLGATPVVFLYAPPYAYKLLPTSKTGVRFPASAMPVGGSGTSFNLQAMLRNPAALRASMQKRGARNLGKAQMSGVPVDIYAANSFLFLGQTFKAKTWLRHSDALPLRLELTSPKASVIVSWRNYQRNQVLPKTLFAVPAGYSVRSRAQSPG